MRSGWGLALWSLTAAVGAADWSFGDKQVLAGHRSGVFHHLDSTGRQHVAVSGNSLGIVWEDNRDGTPQVYVVFKPLEAVTFRVAKRLSAGRAAAEPVIAGLGDNRFVVAWEQDGRVRLRVAGPDGIGTMLTLDDAQASQPSLTTGQNRTVMAYVRSAGRFGQVVTRELDVDKSGRITPGPAVAVDPAPPKDDQFAPVVAMTRQGVTVVWEDRRQGHTVLLFSHVADKTFAAPRPLNEQVQKSDVYGRGSGVTRAALAAYGNDRLAAAWMDKRGFLTGYDIFAAVSADGGRSFGKNEQVQDEFGNEIPQWRAAIAGNRQGTLVAAFDDTRDETSNVQLSVRSADGSWGANFTPPPASGSGEQSHPALALDERGHLHLVWLERVAEGQPTRLLYSHGRPAAR